jgi:hypothetical protein
MGKISKISRTDIPKNEERTTGWRHNRDTYNLIFIKFYNLLFLMKPKKAFGKDLEEVYKQEKAREKRERIQGKRRPGPKHEQHASESGLSRLIERINPEADVSLISDTYFFQNSLRELRKKGYDRHLFSSEYFSILLANLENRLYDKEKQIAENILSGLDEWVNLAMFRTGDKLICLQGIDNRIIYTQRKKRFEWAGLRESASVRKEYNIKEIPSLERIDLDIFSDNLIKFLYGRTYEEMPEQIKTGERNSWIEIPKPDALTVMYRTFYSLSCWDVENASRGIKNAEIGLSPNV